MHFYSMNQTDAFNKILYEELFKEENDDDNQCLISLEKLEEDSVKLRCNHNFNYIPLFRDLVNQKKRNGSEISRLSLNQIRCPYCRTIQNGLIPYNDKYKDLKFKGVNYPPSKVLKNNKCCMLLKSGKRKGEMCNINCFGKFCKRHAKTNENINQNKCNAILKTGKKKGEKCLKNCGTTNTKCGIHNKDNFISNN